MKNRRDAMLIYYPKVALRAGYGDAPPPRWSINGLLPRALGQSDVQFCIPDARADEEYFGDLRRQWKKDQKYRFSTAGYLQKQKQVVFEFFKHYAFDRSTTSVVADLQAPQWALSGRRPCYIYPLGSLINHCCPVKDKGVDDPGRGPNCEAHIGPSGLTKFPGRDDLAIRARRDIEKGTELTLDYGKRKMGFVCKCVGCQKTFGRFKFSIGKR